MCAMKDSDGKWTRSHGSLKHEIKNLFEIQEKIFANKCKTPGGDKRDSSSTNTNNTSSKSNNKSSKSSTTNKSLKLNTNHQNQLKNHRHQH